MSKTLCIAFSDEKTFAVHFGDEQSDPLSFVNPLSVKDSEEIRWYVEVYGSQWTAEPDDVRAAEIAAKLSAWGKNLFDAVFMYPDSMRLYRRFLNERTHTRSLTIAATRAAVLSVPWELLHDSREGGLFLFNENPRISIKRTLPDYLLSRRRFDPIPKEKLHLLFVVSRPTDCSLLDPRAEPSAVMDAIEENARESFTWEFLRPATFKGLVERLQDKTRPTIDILHFDGHGYFDRPNNTGYLCFEKLDGGGDDVPALGSEGLGHILSHHKIPLVILSACETAAISDDHEPIGTVAVGLISAGIPSALAMTYSVLYSTTRQLFGQFYRALANGLGIGASLDIARCYLAQHPEKRVVNRGPTTVFLKLHDWFLPVLYQTSLDVPLLKASKRGDHDSKSSSLCDTMPTRLDARFLGRRQELWDIERQFATDAKRITITGFGGQGKTALAQEAGRWLRRTGMFEHSEFVDCGDIRDVGDKIQMKEGAKFLGKTEITGDAIQAELSQKSVLLILDNLEALASDPLERLLDASVRWSKLGDSRVLCTTQRPEFRNPHNQRKGSTDDRRINLAGLGSRDTPYDALVWFGELMELSHTLRQSEWDMLVALFDQVRFHPLCIQLLARQLKPLEPVELSKRIKKLLCAWVTNSPTTTTRLSYREIEISLRRSIDHLSHVTKQILPLLGVFHGGAMERSLLDITGISKDIWLEASQQLEAEGLVERETPKGWLVPFVRFHPGLAPMVWTELSNHERDGQKATHRRKYCEAAEVFLQGLDLAPEPVRYVVLLELPNLLQAVHDALDARDPKAVQSAANVARLLEQLGLGKETQRLASRLQVWLTETDQLDRWTAQKTWGEYLLQQGQEGKATKVFQTMLTDLVAPSGKEKAFVMLYVARCFRADGRYDLAAQHARQALAIIDETEQGNNESHERCLCLMELADALMSRGDYSGARQAYEEGRKIATKQSSQGTLRIIVTNLATLNLEEGDLEKAEHSLRERGRLFKEFGDPIGEAVSWHQLGVVLQERRKFNEAEDYYRRSAKIKEGLGAISGLNGAAGTWSQLALLNEAMGRPEQAEMWHRKAISGASDSDDSTGLAPFLTNLAALLQKDPDRLEEAWQLAEKALAMRKSCEGDKGYIWKTYLVLSEILERKLAKAKDSKARNELRPQIIQYRHLMQVARLDYADTRFWLRNFKLVILGAVLALQDPKFMKGLEEVFRMLEREGKVNLVIAIRSFLAGQRGLEVLCGDLDRDEAMIMEAIIRCSADHGFLEVFMPQQDYQGTRMLLAPGFHWRLKLVTRIHSLREMFRIQLD